MQKFIKKVRALANADAETERRYPAFLPRSANPFLLPCLILLICAILLYPQVSLSYALTGLNVWFQNMIPTLFPFMILSGVMIRLGLSEGFAGFFRPLFHPLFRLGNRCLYGVIIGFFCGFPMGAKTAGDMYRLKQISRTEAGFLLSFCNNIGPVFFTGFVLPLLPGNVPAIVYLFGMYGIPLTYGLFLRYFVYGNALPVSAARSQNKGGCVVSGGKIKKPPSFAAALDDSITSGIQSITKLGGYMIFFNTLNILPLTLLTIFSSASASLLIPIRLLLEITGGIAAAGSEYPLLILSMLQFGGLSCIAQTYGMIADTDISILPYIGHKLCQTALAFGYYSVSLKLFY